MLVGMEIRRVVTGHDDSGNSVLLQTKWWRQSRLARG